MSETSANTVETRPVGFERVVRFFIPRGVEQIRAFATAMAHEVWDNDHKGHWFKQESIYNPTTKTFEESDVDRTDEQMISDLLYHATKLGLACRVGDRTAILEYAADVGNCAMFLADRHDTLDLDLLHVGPIEYDSEHLEGIKQGDLKALKVEMNLLANDIFTREIGKEDEKAPFS